MTSIPKPTKIVREERLTSPSTPYKRLEMLVYKKGNEEILHRRVFKAVKGRVFSEQGVENALTEMALMIEQHLPDREFRLVELSGGRFKFFDETPEKDPNEGILFRADILPSEQSENPVQGETVAVESPEENR